MTTTPLTPKALADLKRLAEAATPGPYVVDVQRGYTDDYVRTKHEDRLPHPNDIVAEASPANARYIAAVNPQTVLALIAENAHLRAQVAAQAEEIEGVRAEVQQSCPHLSREHHSGGWTCPSCGAHGTAGVRP